MAISREALLKPIPVATEKVLLPEFGNGEYVMVHGMTARERSEFEQQFVGKAGQSNKRRQLEYRERLIVQCCRDDDGNRMFTVDDVAALGQQQTLVTERIVDAAMRVCGMKQSDDLVGNSGETQAEDLPSG